ncbi:hypothetical protein [Bradyrhizobium cenepequi]
MSGIAAVSKEAADNAYQLGEQQLQWAKDQFAQNKAVTDQVVQKALDTQDTLNANAAADRKRYEDVLLPQRDALINDANTYATQEKKDQEVGKAQAAVGQQFEAARNNATQSLESYGVNPASTRFGALDIGTRAMEAAAKAAAGNTAIQQTDQTARDLRAQAINAEAGLPTQSLAETNAGTATGTGAVNNGLATTQTGASTQGTGVQYDSLGNAAAGQAANTTTQGYQNSLNQYKADQASSSGVGSVLGGLAGLGLGVAGLSGSSVGGKALSSLFAADGGAIPAVGDATPGGAVPVGASPTGGKAVDDVPAQLTVGEFVIPKDVAAWKGEEHFQKLIQQARQAKQQATAKPSVGAAPARAAAFRSSPQQGAIPMGQAA